MKKKYTGEKDIKELNNNNDDNKNFFLKRDDKDGN